jgi:hypothetical protein
VSTHSAAQQVFGAAQKWPHPPQAFGSELRFKQVPAQHSIGAGPHCFPHRPQLFGSLRRLEHTPPQQTAGAWHELPHFPQLSSLLRSTQLRLQQ